MKKLGIAVLLIIALTFSLPVLAKAIVFTNPSSDQSPYPPPETPSNPEVFEVPIAPTPYPGPENPLETMPPSSQRDNADLIVSYDYQIFLPMIINSYDRIKAVAYADTWAHARNGNYPTYGTKCGCTDCTNYVSQAIHDNGNLALKIGDWDPSNVFEWWYKKVLWWYENSNTWSATDWFNTYVAQYPDEFEIYPWPTNLMPGDFFTMDLRGATPSDPPDGIPDHIRFVLGYGNTSTNQIDYTDGCGNNNSIPTMTYTLLIDQHCVDRKHVAWDYKLPGSIGRWSIHVK